MVAERTGCLFDGMDDVIAYEAGRWDSMNSISFSEHGGISGQEVMGVCWTVVASVLSFDKGSTPNDLNRPSKSILRERIDPHRRGQGRSVHAFRTSRPNGP